MAAFAPGRIEFLGNHLDYNGGMVLGAAIDAGIYVLASPRRDKGLRLFSESFEGEVVETGLDQFRKIEGKGSWANYCLGVLKAMQERGLAPSSGFSLTFVSNLPVSAGLSSSAALELATGLALAQLADREVGLEELAGICREAENDFVGMPCGILDQASSALGRPDHLVLIDCRNESFSTLPSLPVRRCGSSTRGSSTTWSIPTTPQGMRNAGMPFVSSRRPGASRLAWPNAGRRRSTRRTCPRTFASGPCTSPVNRKGSSPSGTDFSPTATLGNWDDYLPTPTGVRPAISRTVVPSWTFSSSGSRNPMRCSEPA